MAVPDFLRLFDFMVYFTAPTWTESFGRVIAEAVAAGKVVIAGPEAKAVFGDAVVEAKPTEVDAIIARMVARPEDFAAQVRSGQAALSQWGPAAFLDRVASFAGFGVPA
jgi:hypothetical protein